METPFYHEFDRGPRVGGSGKLNRGSFRGAAWLRLLLVILLAIFLCSLVGGCLPPPHGSQPPAPPKPPGAWNGMHGASWASRVEG